MMEAVVNIQKHITSSIHQIKTYICNAEELRIFLFINFFFAFQIVILPMVAVGIKGSGVTMVTGVCRWHTSVIICRIVPMAMMKTRCIVEA